MRLQLVRYITWSHCSLLDACLYRVESDSKLLYSLGFPRSILLFPYCCCCHCRFTSLCFAGIFGLQASCLHTSFNSSFFVREQHLSLHCRLCRGLINQIYLALLRGLTTKYLLPPPDLKPSNSLHQRHPTDNYHISKMPFFKRSLAGPAYVILNGIRVCNVVALLSVVAASFVMLVKTFTVSKFFFFDGVSHLVRACISSKYCHLIPRTFLTDTC